MDGDGREKPREMILVNIRGEPNQMIEGGDTLMWLTVIGSTVTVIGCTIMIVTAMGYASKYIVEAVDAQTMVVKNEMEKHTDLLEQIALSTRGTAASHDD